MHRKNGINIIFVVGFLHSYFMNINKIEKYKKRNECVYSLRMAYVLIRDVKWLKANFFTCLGALSGIV